MATYAQDETSVQNANPVELYLFKYHEEFFCYTSTKYAITQEINGEEYEFTPDYIKRGDSLKLGDSGGTIETCIITVLRTNPIARLFQGPPPEQDTVKVEIWRQHGSVDVTKTNVVRILRGTVSQVRFHNSEAELTITIEHVLTREIPRGKLSYFCQNTIYDSKCALKESAYMDRLSVNNGVDGLATIDKLIIYSNGLKNKPSGYYTDGFMKMGSTIRAIKDHTGDHITIKYPITNSERDTTFYVWPACNGLFKVCHERFKNTDRFSGVVYQQPYNAFKHPLVQGGYWIDGSIVVRDTNGRIYTGPH